MKKILLFITIISLNSFSQNDLKKSDNLGNFFRAADVEENHVLINEMIEKLNLQIFEEIKSSENLKKHSIAEAKFSLKNQINQAFNKKIQNNLENEKLKLNESLLIEMNDNFLKNIISKILLEENKAHEIILSDISNYGDQNIELYRNYSSLENKLLISYTLDKNINIQIGNSILPYLNKIVKTDVEKTLNTSLNLLAVNF